LDGTDDYIAIPPMNLNTNTLTITAWIKRNGIQSAFSGIVMCVSPDTKSGLNFYYNNKLGYHWNGSAWSWDSGLTIPTGEWCFVALVVRPNQAKLYLNDVSVIRTDTHDPDEFDGIWRVGNYGGWTDRFYKGLIDDVIIWDRDLTDQEILTIYYSGLNGNTIDHATPVNSEFNWSLLLLFMTVSIVISGSLRIL